MRDEMDARIWGEHHEAFTDAIDDALARVRGPLSKVRWLEGSRVQWFAILLASTISTLTITGTAGA